MELDKLSWHHFKDQLINVIIAISLFHRVSPSRNLEILKDRPRQI